MISGLSDYDRCHADTQAGVRCSRRGHWLSVVVKKPHCACLGRKPHYCGTRKPHYCPGGSHTTAELGSRTTAWRKLHYCGWRELYYTLLRSSEAALRTVAALPLCPLFFFVLAPLKTP
jgi:hypothetical protein